MFSLINRRRFLQSSGLLIAGTSIGGPANLGQVRPAAGSVLDPGTLASFVDPLPVPPVARPVGSLPHPEIPGKLIPAYRISMRETLAKLHRDLPPTRLRTLGGYFPGMTIEARSGQGICVEWKNELPNRHFLPIDHTLHGAGENLPESRCVVHLHGGRTPAESDGYPENWVQAGNSQHCFYPLQQDAAQLFYHDHTMGINRLNTYAGMQGMLLVRDATEDGLQLPSGKYEIPLLVCDRLLRPDGQLYYPVSPNPKTPWVPEVFGNAILANGKLQPFLDVEPRKYRFRVMNGSNGRFFRFSLANRAEFHQIGSDQGLLAHPVAMRHSLLAPGERADWIIDFAGMRGETVELHSDTFPVLQFRVSDEAIADSGVLPAILRPLPRLPETAAVQRRQLTLDEQMDPDQQSMGMLLNNTPWHMPVTEKPVLNTTEIWELINLTDDSHPIHLHLVRFQILDRRRFDSFHFQATRELRYTGPAMPPAPEEQGWKDTVRADPNMVTRIIVPFQGYPGRYVWHCHILEHEDNEMMRPLEVMPEKSAIKA